MREIIICDYDEAWPQQFEDERLRIHTALSPIVYVIEHIGSTSVPMLGAKPVIDMMIGVESEHELDSLISPIESLGYSYRKEHEAEMPYRRFFRRDTNGIRSHHIHAVARSHPFWDKHITFRDRLRTSPDDAREYEALKRRLAAEYRFDPDGYTDAKADLIHQIIARTEAVFLIRS